LLGGPEQFLTDRLKRARWAFSFFSNVPRESCDFSCDFSVIACRESFHGSLSDCSCFGAKPLRTFSNPFASPRSRPLEANSGPERGYSNIRVLTLVERSISLLNPSQSVQPMQGEILADTASSFPRKLT
jgi:hypothetical protein